MFTPVLLLQVLIALGVVGVGLVAWAMLGDLSRGRKRCPKCWYSMDGAPPPPDPTSLRCPECGHVARKEKHLRRARVRWKALFAGYVLVLLPLTGSLLPRASQYGVGSVVPATVLIFFFEFDDAEWIRRGISYHAIYSDTSLSMEERGRLLWQWQWRRLGEATLRRLDAPSGPLDHRTRSTYYFWLSGVRLHAGDAEQRDRIMRAVVRDMADADPRVRNLAVQFSVDPAALDDSLQHVLHFVERHSDGSGKVAAARALGKIAQNHQDAARRLVEWLADDDPRVRAAGLSGLRAAGPRGRHDHLPGAYEAVRSMEDDPGSAVRRGRIETLAHFQSEDEAWDTIELAWLSDDLAVRAGAFDAASRRESERPDAFARIVIEAVEQSIERFSAGLRVKLMDAALLAPYADRLEALAEDEDQWVREAVQEALLRLQRAGG